MEKVSWFTDGDGNLIERYEDVERGAIDLRVKLSPKTQKTATDVERWYWQRVGVR